MRNLFHKSLKAKSPVEVVREVQKIILTLTGNHGFCGSKLQDKMKELHKRLLDLKCILYGIEGADPIESACEQVTAEFFKEDTLRLLVIFLPKMDLEARKDATLVLRNLLKQRVKCRLIASTYLESNLDLVDTLITGYEDQEIALQYGSMLRECLRHQIVARHVLEAKHMRKLFSYIQLPDFTIASDAMATFKELMTRHKSTVAEFLNKNYDWFFQDYNLELLESKNYVTKWQALGLLGQMLLDRSNYTSVERYVNSKDNLRLLMNLLRESSKKIQIESFNVFKLFADNKNKPPEISKILVANRSKLLQLLGGLHMDKQDENFERDKSLVIKEIALLEVSVSC